MALHVVLVYSDCRVISQYVNTPRLIWPDVGGHLGGFQFGAVLSSAPLCFCAV